MIAQKILSQGYPCERKTRSCEPIASFAGQTENRSGKDSATKNAASLFRESRARYVRLARFDPFLGRFELVLDERQFPRDLVGFRVGVLGDESSLLQLRHQLVHPFLVLLAPVL